jgi:hypothetical protein
MVIQIRKPKNPRGNLSVYRKTYQRAQEVRGVHVPGHVSVEYVGKLPRFGTIGELEYLKPKNGQQAPAPLDADELNVLQQFLERDAVNWSSTWPKELYDEIEAAVRSELFAGITEQSNLDVLANTLRGAGPEIEHEAKLYRDQGQVLAEGWGNEARKTDATGLSELTRLKARVNEVRQAWTGFEAAVQAAGMIVKRPRPSKKGGAQ